MIRTLPLFFLLFLVGCGNTSLNIAQRTIVVTGSGWMELDKQFAPLYEKARISARESSITWEERDEKVAQWEKARSALVATGHALKAAALSITLAQDGFETDWKNQIGCVFDTLESLTEALSVLKVKIPGIIPEAISKARIISGKCGKE